MIDRSDKKDSHEQMSRLANTLVDRNLAASIFPEGTRNKVSNSQLLPFKKGAFHIAFIKGIPIVPVVCSSLKGIDLLTARLVCHPEGQPLSVDSSTLPRELRGMTLAFAGLVERNNALLAAQRRFVANAAHQLRSPMAATQLHLDGVERADNPVERQRSLAQLRRSVERSNRLANQLLSLARLEPGTRLPIPMTRVDLGETTRAAGTDYVPLALNRGIDLSLDLPPSPVEIVGHALLLQEALSNLIDNAVRYHPGQGTIELGVEILAGRAVVTVRDDGPGVDPAFAAQLFTRFARSDESRSAGAGLGLAIVREIVELHRGEVRAEPGADGRGLCIRLEFPLADTTAGVTEETPR